MKKRICLAIALLMVMCCMTACNLNFNSNLSGAAGGKMQATSKVEDMMAAMAENRLEDAEALMHKSVANNSSNSIAQMSAFLAGRKVAKMEQKGINATVDFWGHDVNHDWPWWYKMVAHYVPQLLG